MPRKKVPTTITPAEARRATIVQKDLIKLFDFFRTANVQEGKEGLNPNNMALMFQIREHCFVSRLCNLLPPRKRMAFLTDAEKASFSAHKQWLKDMLPILYPEEMKKILAR